MENFEKCTVAMLGGPCSQHVTGNTSRQNQPQSAIIPHLYLKTRQGHGREGTSATISWTYRFSLDFEHSAIWSAASALVWIMTWYESSIKALRQQMRPISWILPSQYHGCGWVGKGQGISSNAVYHQLNLYQTATIFLQLSFIHRYHLPWQLCWICLNKLV